MGTIADKLLYLSDTKTTLRTAINAAGGALTVSTPFRQYAKWVTEQSATLSLDFVKQSYIAKTSALVPDRIGFSNIITFTRASGGGRFNASGDYEFLGNDVPRLDYDPVTLAPRGLLIEEQRTNSALNSNSFSASTGTLVLANNLPSPDGTQTADFIYENTSSGEHYAGDRNVSVAAGKIYVWSVFVKAPQLSSRELYLRIAGAAVSTVRFNPKTKLIVASGAQNISFGFQEIKGGWFRVWNVFSAASTANAVCRVQLFNGTTAIYTGDGTSGLYVWGAQLEAGAFPTSYIPTEASQVTRSADVASVNTLSPWYNASEGSLYFEGASLGLGTGSASYAAALTDNSVNEVITIRRNASGFGGEVIDGGAAQVSLTPAYSNGVITNIALAIKANDFALSKDGATALTDTSGSLPAVDRLNIGATAILSAHLNGHIQSIRYYPRRLTNAELKILTTP